MSSKIIDLIKLLITEISNETHKTELKVFIDSEDKAGLVKCLKRHSKLEHQKIRNKRCYYKKKKQPIDQCENITWEIA